MAKATTDGHKDHYQQLTHTDHDHQKGNKDHSAINDHDDYNDHKDHYDVHKDDHDDCKDHTTGRSQAPRLWFNCFQGTCVRVFESQDFKAEPSVNFLHLTFQLTVAKTLGFQLTVKGRYIYSVAINPHSKTASTIFTYPRIAVRVRVKSKKSTSTIVRECRRQQKETLFKKSRDYSLLKDWCNYKLRILSR